MAGQMAQQLLSQQASIFLAMTSTHAFLRWRSDNERRRINIQLYCYEDRKTASFLNFDFDEIISPTGTSVEAFGSSIGGLLPNAVRNTFSADSSVMQKAQPFLAAAGGLALTYYTAKALCCLGKVITTYFLAGPLHLGADLKKSGD
jgi:hypothetical protein